LKTPRWKSKHAVSANLEGAPDPAAAAAADGVPFLSPTHEESAETLTLGALPLGARLILRCRKDWRAAAVCAFEPDLARVVLSVASPSGHTYRLRRPADAPLALDGPLPVLGQGTWRAAFARYDLRW
jgi:hypothetical protein